MRISSWLIPVTAFLLGASWSPAEHLADDPRSAQHYWQSLPDRFQEMLTELKLDGPPSGYRASRLGGFQALYPARGSPSGVLLTHDDFALAAASRGVSVQLSGNNSLGALDRDGDGWHETVSYTVRDPDTGRWFRVRDTDRDGIADVKRALAPL